MSLRNDYFIQQWKEKQLLTENKSSKLSSEHNTLRSKAQSNQSKPVIKHLCSWVHILLLIRNQRGKLVSTKSAFMPVNGAQMTERNGEMSARCITSSLRLGKIHTVSRQQKLRARWPSAHGLAGDISAGSPHTHKDNTHFYLTLLKHKPAQTQVHLYEQAHTYILTCTHQIGGNDCDAICL